MMKSFAFSDLNRKSGDVLDAAMAGPVALKKFGKDRLVVLPVEHFKHLVQAAAPKAEVFSTRDAPDFHRENMLAAAENALAELKEERQ